MSSEMEAKVAVFFKPEFNDPNSEHLTRQLQKSPLGEKFTNVKVGKLFSLSLNAKNAEDAKIIVENVSEQLLANPVYEKCEVDYVKPKTQSSESLE